ncbi:hypothetical protein NKH77_17490 [Streptomyces sp. M19]
MYARLERYEEAAAFHQQAAAVHRELGDAWHEAIALDGLAASLEADRPEEARRRWGDVLHLLAGFDDPCALELRARAEARRGT